MITVTMCSFPIPCVIVFISLIIEIDEVWSKHRWLLILFFGITFCWAQEFTITFEFIAEDITWLIYSLLSPSGYATGAFLSLIGLGIGTLARKFSAK